MSTVQRQPPNATSPEHARRRFPYVLVLAALLLTGLVPALGALGATGDGTFSVKDVYGAVTVVGKGAVWGQLDRGALTITDPNPTDGVIKVSGYSSVKPGRADHSLVYTGANIHFQIVGGQYKLQVKTGEGIDLSAVGIGKATLAGDALAGVDPGTYALEGGKWQPVPFVSTTVAFGSAVSSTGTTTTTTTTTP
jgi:hypothetical protein